MRKRAIIALAALALGTAGYAADRENTDPSTGRTSAGSAMGTEARGDISVDRSVDTTRADVKRVDSRSMTAGRPVDEDRDDDRGARTGGYLAAGIGIAALIGLFASRKTRAGRSRGDYDDFNRPSGSPRI